MSPSTLNGIVDPWRRVAVATDELTRLRRDLAAVSEIRDTAILELAAAGETYHRIAQVAGVTRGRVAQILQRARHA